MMRHAAVARRHPPRRLLHFYENKITPYLKVITIVGVIATDSGITPTLPSPNSSTMMMATPGSLLIVQLASVMLS